MRYFNFLTFSNGDFIFETYSSAKEKIFYGLKSNGRNYFNNSQNNSFFFINTNINKNIEVYGSNSIFIKNDEEYYLNMIAGRGLISNYGTEIYDLNQKKIYYKLTRKILDFEDYNYRGNLIYLGNNTYIYPGVYRKEAYKYIPVITKFQLNLIDNVINSEILIKKEINIFSNNIMINCFKTEKNGIIICFSDFRDNENILSFYYYIAAYNQDLEYLCNYTQKITYNNEDTFISSIALKDDIGAFIYFEYYLKPIIFFKGYDNSNNCFKDYYEQIKLDHVDYHWTTRKTNDFIKISNDKICFISSSAEQYINIIIINLFNNNGDEPSYHIKIRYYQINLKFIFLRLKGSSKVHLFKNFIALAAGYYFDNDNNFLNYYVNSLMIIGYPNKTDSNFDIINYIKKEKCQINNLKIDLVEDMTIDNNIFGYKYKSIKYMII